MKISLTSTVNKKYKRRAYAILLILAVFVITPFLVPQQKASAGTKIGSSIDTGDTLVYLENATYYKENNLLEVAILSQGKDITNRELNVKAVATNKKNKKYPVKQEKINDNFIILFITDVPSDFNQVKIVLTDQGKSSDMFEATLDPFFVTPTNVKETLSFIPKGTNDYKKAYLDGLISIQETHLKSIDDQINELKEQITALEKSSSDVTADVELMTGSEKQKAMDKIKQNTSQINQLKTQIQTKEDEKVEYKEKIKRVESAQ